MPKQTRLKIELIIKIGSFASPPSLGVPLIPELVEEQRRGLGYKYVTFIAGE
jgi:hypothetical protein